MDRFNIDKEEYTSIIRQPSQLLSRERDDPAYIPKPTIKAGCHRSSIIFFVDLF